MVTAIFPELQISCLKKDTGALHLRRGSNMQSLKAHLGNWEKPSWKQYDGSYQRKVAKMLEHPEIGWIERTGYPSWLQESGEGIEDNEWEDNYAD